jgi:hypothetical protein
MEDSHIVALRRHHKPILAVSTKEVGIYPLPGKLNVFRKEV